MKTLVSIVNTMSAVLLFTAISLSAQAQNKPIDSNANAGVHGHDMSVPMPPPPPPCSAGLPAPPPPPPPPPPSEEGMDQGRPGLDLPDLTPDQLAKIKKTDLKNMADMTPLRNQVREKRARLATIMATIPVDLRQADVLADEIGKTASSILKLQIRHDQELRAILTPDQQVLFDARPKPWLRRP